MPRAWKSTLYRHGILLLLGALVGWIYGHLLAGMLLVALSMLAWHLFNLYRLDQWLRTGRIEVIPDGAGVWPPVFAKIEYIREKAWRRRRRLQRLVGEMRASASTFPDGGVLLSAQHEILAFNAAAERLLGLQRSRDRGQRIGNLVRHPAFVAYLDSTSHSAGVELPGPVGHDMWISCRLIPYGPDQQLLLVRDITASVRMERTRRDFVANASHELRTPLTVISGYLETLAEDGSAPVQWRQPVLEMRTQSKRMGQLLDDLLQLSRLESAPPCPLDREVDMAAIVQIAQREALAMPGGSARVEVDVASTDGVLGDEAELHSVVSNLVSNAVRYTPAEGTIRISWSVDRDGGHLSVADTGIGIAEDDIPRITERFYRTDHGRARQKGGTGLGLAIVKHSLRRHDAELEIRSRLGEGSTFTCHFPRHRLAVSS